MSMNGDNDTYDHTHRAFLQCFLSRSTLTFAEAQPILADLKTTYEDRATLSNDIRRSDFNEYINTLNAALSPYDYEIRQAIPQTYARRSNNAVNGSASTQASSQEPIYALVNTTSDPTTQLATVHKPEEIAFLKRVLDKMFDTNNATNREIMAVTTMQALEASKSSAGGRHSDVNGNINGASATGGLTKSQAETMLRSLLDEGWFVKMGGYLTLSPRALLELRDWLRETYNEPAEEDDEEPVEKVKSCAACREIVTIGQRCTRRTCKARLHEHCLGSYFRMQGGRQRCGVCKEEWTNDCFVGPKAARTNRNAVGGGRRQQQEPEMAEEEEEDQTPAPRRAGLSNGVLAAAKGKQRVAEASRRRDLSEEVQDEDDDRSDLQQPNGSGPGRPQTQGSLEPDDDE